MSRLTNDIAIKKDNWDLPRVYLIVPMKGGIAGQPLYSQSLEVCTNSVASLQLSQLVVFTHFLFQAVS